MSNRPLLFPRGDDSLWLRVRSLSRASGRWRADRKSTRLNSSHANIYTLSLRDALPISAITWPAVCMACLSNGRPVLHATSEFPISAFAPTSGKPECQIGRSCFRAETTAYGSGFVVSVELPAVGGQIGRAHV